MYAILRSSPYDPSRLEQATDMLTEFEALHSAQPGYAGTMVIDVGDHRRFSVTLWATQRDAAAARSALGPAVGRLIEPLLRGPSELVGVGDVIATDLVHRPRDAGGGAGVRPGSP